jgi:NADPH:quinone reductase-like Zn-dependent oxidoreductase
VTPDQGACLGIPGITAHRAVHVGGDVAGRTVLVQGAGGAVGMCAVALARHSGARAMARCARQRRNQQRGRRVRTKSFSMTRGWWTG